MNDIYHKQHHRYHYYYYQYQCYHYSNYYYYYYYRLHYHYYPNYYYYDYYDFNYYHCYHHYLYLYHYNSLCSLPTTIPYILSPFSRMGKVASLLAIVGRARKKLEVGRGTAITTTTTTTMTAGVAVAVGVEVEVEEKVEMGSETKLESVGGGTGGSEIGVGDECFDDLKAGAYEKDRGSASFSLVPVISFCASSSVREAGSGSESIVYGPVPDTAVTPVGSDHKQGKGKMAAGDGEVEVEMEGRESLQIAVTIMNTERNKPATSVMTSPQCSPHPVHLVPDPSDINRTQNTPSVPIPSLSNLSKRDSFSLRPPPSLRAEGTYITHSRNSSNRVPLRGWPSDTEMGADADIVPNISAPQHRSKHASVSHIEGKKKKKKKVKILVKDTQILLAHTSTATSITSDSCADKGGVADMLTKSTSQTGGREMPKSKVKLGITAADGKVQSRLSNRGREKEKSVIEKKKKEDDEEDDDEEDEDALAAEYQLLKLQMERNMHVAVAVAAAARKEVEIEIEVGDASDGIVRGQRGRIQIFEGGYGSGGIADYQDEQGHMHEEGTSIDCNEERSRKASKSQGRNLIQGPEQVPSSSRKIKGMSRSEVESSVNGSVSDKIAAMSAKDILSFFEEQDKLEENGWNSSDHDEDSDDEEGDGDDDGDDNNDDGGDNNDDGGDNNDDYINREVEDGNESNDDDDDRDNEYGDEEEDRGSDGREVEEEKGG